MANDIDTLLPALERALRDESDPQTWMNQEKADLIRWAIADLWPRVSREIDQTATANKITLVAGTYFYALPAGVLAVSRVDYVDGQSNEAGPLAPGSWEVTGDPLAATSTAKLHIPPSVAEAGGSLRLIGYGRYDLVTGASGNLIPDELVPLVLATARAEAYRRMGSDRARFEAWLTRNQVENISINELVILINEADSEAERLWRRHKKWQRPVPARHP